LGAEAGASAYEVEVVLKRVRSAGNGTRCSESNVTTINAGSDAAFVFNGFGLTRAGPEVARRGSLVSRCVIQVNLRIPQGYFLKGYRNTVGYGIIKSEGIGAAITSRLSFFGPMVHDSDQARNLYQKNVAIDEPFDVLSISEEIPRAKAGLLCRRALTGDYVVAMTLAIDLRAQHMYAMNAEPIFEGHSAEVSMNLLADLEPCGPGGPGRGKNLAGRR